MAPSQTRVFIVSTTHWDRAWYVPFQEFRWSLVELVDQVLDLLEHRPGYEAFMLDGQSVTLEDYLEIRPEREADVRRLVESGRLQVGPWYVLPDEYLVSPEALVRNLLIGTRLARQLGGRAMLHGYNPDSFGHIGQLPQILRGFGIETTLFWRGFGDEGERIPNEFWWEAPDGSRVLASFLRLGYGNASQIGYPMRWGEVRPLRFDPELAVRQAVEVIEALRRHAAADAVLLLNGTDHTLPQPEIPEVVERLRAQGYDARHATIEEYFAAVRERRPELPTLRGEFNRGRYSPILQSVYSSRMPLKQRNWAVQQLLERLAEPAASMAWLYGSAYPARALEVAWRWLLKNHPHDDICGSSVDQVHREMVYRFDQAEQIGRIVARESLRAIAERVRLERPGPALVVFNPSLVERREVLVAAVPFASGPDGEAGTLRPPSVVDAQGRRQEVQVLAEREEYWAEPRRTRPRRVLDVAFQVEVPAGGFATYYLEPGATAAVAGAEGSVRVTGDRQMENDRIRLRVERDGTLFLEEKGSGRRYGPLHFFEDTEDAGDEYDFSPAAHSTTVWSLGLVPSFRWVEQGPMRATMELRWELELPAGLAPHGRSRSEERVTCPVVTRVSLKAGERRAEFVTDLDNRARDHRLRAWFETGIQSSEVLVDGHFEVLRRPARIIPHPDWHQPPVPTGLARRWVAVARTDGSGLAVLSRGLPEYEPVPGKSGVTLALTLLRSVGYLSREGLLTRPHGAGPSMAAPEAQLIGHHRLEYAVQLFTDLADLQQAAEAYHHPLVAVRADTRLGMLPEEVRAIAGDPALLRPERRDLPDRVEGLRVEPASIYVSAVKRSEDGQALVVRLANILDTPSEVSVVAGFPLKEAWKARLDETPEEALETRGDGVKLTVKAGQVVTIRLVPVR
ncbi:MAG: hypothetical protein IMX02_08580 [Limnochordaceae bacterium]|nr:hypothetical protein [Limnochordaceae bacterium]